MQDGDFLAHKAITESDVAVEAGQTGLDALVDRAPQRVDLNHCIGLQADLASKTIEAGLASGIQGVTRRRCRHADLRRRATGNHQPQLSLLDLQARAGGAHRHGGTRNTHMQVVVRLADGAEQLHLDGGQALALQSSAGHQIKPARRTINRLQQQIATAHAGQALQGRLQLAEQQAAPGCIGGAADALDAARPVGFTDQAQPQRICPLTIAQPQIEGAHGLHLKRSHIAPGQCPLESDVPLALACGAHTHLARPHARQ